MFPGPLPVRYFPLPERGPNELGTKEQRRRNGERTEIYRTSIENRTEAPLSNHGAKITNRQASMRQYYAMVRHSAPFWVVLWFSKLLIRSGRLAMVCSTCSEEGTCEAGGGLKDATYAEGDAERCFEVRNESFLAP